MGEEKLIRESARIYACQPEGYNAEAEPITCTRVGGNQSVCYGPLACHFLEYLYSASVSSLLILSGNTYKDLTIGNPETRPKVVVDSRITGTDLNGGLSY